MHHRLSHSLIGFLQAAGVFAYVLTLGLVAFSGKFPTPIVDPVLVLFFFCFSVLLCGTLVGAYPILLLAQKRYDEAITVFLATVVSMGLLLFLLAGYYVKFGAQFMPIY
ncbi:MAG: hypothetical protein Q7R81_03850 [Candidatus Peregrinibacteria bacterium]|nr:hypothetical protein [Candidatus Peregrinibacteria bacterium]